MTFKIILSGKLKYQLLTDDGFRYKRKCKPRGPNFLTYYKCVLDTCTATAATVGGPDMDQIRLKYHALPNKPHNHPGDQGSNEAHEILHKYRKMARQKPEEPAKAIFEEVLAAEAASGGNPLANDDLGTFSYHRNMFYRIRKQNTPNQPSNLNEVDIKVFGESTNALDGGPFHRCTTLSKSELFLSSKQVEIAAESSSLFIDGTFAICPKPFKQVLILRGKVGSSVHTIAYALLPDKKEKTYNDTLKAILEVCTEMDVAYVHCDCEQGLVNAVERHFPNAQIRLFFSCL